MFDEFSSIIFQGGPDCLITYTATCMDGSLRTVDLTVRDFCGGADTKTKTYKALRDTSTFMPLRFRLGTAVSHANSTVTLPLELLDTITATALSPAAFSLLFDSSCARFVSLATPAGSPLQGVPVSISRIAGGMRFETMAMKQLQVDRVPAVLAELTFRTGDPGSSDTVTCPISLAGWTLSSGCINGVMIGGEIRIVPGQTGTSDAVHPPADIELFPDPSNGLLTLRIPSRPGGTVHVTVTDLLGREVMHAQGESATERYQTVLRISPPIPGIYLLFITSGATSWVRPVRVF
jgi:hypothetical protein